MTLRATQVFTPGSFPEHTYVERTDEKLEQSLVDALETPGQIISLSGPSKSGKTVLVEKVVGRDNLITITGAGIQEPSDIWTKVLDWMEVPQSQSKTRTNSRSIGGELAIEGGAEIPFVAAVEGSAKGSAEIGHARTEVVAHGRRGLEQVVEEIANSTYVVLLDDFHYMPRSIQVDVAKIIKEAVRLGVKVCTAAVTHRGDDVVRANPELRGRVRTIDLKYWEPKELQQIANLGFAQLNVRLTENAISEFTKESAGSPQLMQLICLHACFVMGFREKADFTEVRELAAGELLEIFERTASSTDFRSLVDVLDSGPKTRGTERKMYRFTDGSEGDVYRCILRALASDPPQLSFDYATLTRRVDNICNREPPVGSSVVGTCLHMSRLALDKFPSERAIDWDESKQILDIPDPYLLFYLRWSGRLTEPE